MRTGRPKATLTISSDERTQLKAITRSRSLPAALTLRAKIVLAYEREPSNAVVATRLGVAPHTIGKWRNRFIPDRIEGLYDEMRTGRPRTVEDEAVAEMITKTLARKPKAATHWSVRAIAKETGIAKSTVHRLFQLFGLQPHRTRSFKLSTDPFFVEKLRDVVGLYLNPPDKAVVLCVNEKSQIQALERTQPMLPMGFGYIEGVTHDYVMAQPLCSPPLTCSTAQSSLNAKPAIVAGQNTRSPVPRSCGAPRPFRDGRAWLGAFELSDEVDTTALSRASFAWLEGCAHSRRRDCSYRSVRAISTINLVSGKVTVALP